MPLDFLFEKRKSSEENQLENRNESEFRFDF